MQTKEQVTEKVTKPVTAKKAKTPVKKKATPIAKAKKVEPSLSLEKAVEEKLTTEAMEEALTEMIGQTDKKPVKKANKIFTVDKYYILLDTVQVVSWALIGVAAIVASLSLV